MQSHLTPAMITALVVPEDRIREQRIDQYRRQFFAATETYSRREAWKFMQAEIAQRTPRALEVLRRLDIKQP